MISIYGRSGPHSGLKHTLNASLSLCDVLETGTVIYHTVLPTWLTSHFRARVPGQNFFKQQFDSAVKGFFSFFIIFKMRPNILGTGIHVYSEMLYKSH